MRGTCGCRSLTRACVVPSKPICYTDALLQPTTRRRFLLQSAAGAASAALSPFAEFATAASEPNQQFPSATRDRISIASYPFREFVFGPRDDQKAPSRQSIALKDFAAHVISKFGVNKIEPWSLHFPSTDSSYLAELRASLEKSHASIVNIAVDGRHSQYSLDQKEREQAVAFGKQWIDVAVALGSPSVRTHIASAKDSQPDVGRAAASLSQVAEYGSTKNVVVHLENDDPVSEDPFFIVSVLDKVNSPWLRANPDFANSLTTGKIAYAYKGIAALFARAYGICHVKAMEPNDKGELVHVDMDKTFGILMNSHYRGYLSMEFDSPGDPYEGTSALIKSTLEHLS